MVKGRWFSTGIPRFIARLWYCVLYKLKVCGNPASSKALGAIFPIAFAHFLSLCQHMFTSCLCHNFNNISDFFVIIFFIMNKLISFCCGDLSSVIFDFTVVILVHHKQCPYKVASVRNVYVLIAPLAGHPPISLPLLRPPHSNVEIRPINSPTMAARCSSERKSHQSLNWNVRHG